MSQKKAKKPLESRIQRFKEINAKMRIATLESERAFLRLAGNISPSQLQIILIVGENPGSTMSELANMLHVSQANITQMVTKLISKKYLSRKQCQSDRRVSYIDLLKKGKDIVDLHQAHVEKVAKDFLSMMTDKEQEAMLNVWERFVK